MKIHFVKGEDRIKERESETGREEGEEGRK